jgi:hypothetical protein
MHAAKLGFCGLSSAELPEMSLAGHVIGDIFENATLWASILHVLGTSEKKGGGRIQTESEITTRSQSSCLMCSIFEDT